MSRYIDADALRADWLENGWMEIKESVVETKNGTLVTVRGENHGRNH